MHHRRLRGRGSRGFRLAYLVLVGGILASLLLPATAAAEGPVPNQDDKDSRPGVNWLLKGLGWHYKQTAIEVTADFTGTNESDVKQALLDCYSLVDYAMMFDPDAPRPRRIVRRELIAAIVDELENRGVDEPGLSGLVAEDVDRSEPPATAHRNERGDGLHVALAMDIVASMTGTSYDDVRAALVDGASLSEYVEFFGVPTQSLIDAIVSAEQAILDQQVAAGELSQAVADALSSRLPDEVTRLVYRRFASGC